MTDFFTYKDLVYLGVIAVTIAGAFFNVKAKTERNKQSIDDLKEQFKEHKLTTDRIHADLVEVKGLLMEIKGYLKIK